MSFLEYSSFFPPLRNIFFPAKNEILTRGWGYWHIIENAGFSLYSCKNFSSSSSFFFFLFRLKIGSNSHKNLGISFGTLLDLQYGQNAVNFCTVRRRLVSAVLARTLTVADFMAFVSAQAQQAWVWDFFLFFFPSWGWMVVTCGGITLTTCVCFNGL